METNNSQKNIQKQFIFIIGSGCSGNSAITDWMKDNKTADIAVFSGDFEELRDSGAIIDAMLGSSNKPFDLIFFKRLALHNTRLLLRSIYDWLRGASSPANSPQIRNSILRYIRRVFLCRALTLLCKYDNIKRYLVKRHLESLSSKQIVVLNNPLFANQCNFHFINTIGIDYQVIYTFRDFNMQFQEWQRLNYDQINEPNLLSFNKINDKLDKFQKMQSYIFGERLKTCEMSKVHFVSFDKFVIDKIYRAKVWAKVFHTEINDEQHNFFDPIRSSANLNMESDSTLSSELDSLSKRYNALI